LIYGCNGITASHITLAGLAQAGMNLARLNMSHGDHASHLQVIRNLKSLSKKLSHPVSILMDLQGPEIRTGELSKSLDLKAGLIRHFTRVMEQLTSNIPRPNTSDAVKKRLFNNISTWASGTERRSKQARKAQTWSRWPIAGPLTLRSRSASRNRGACGRAEHVFGHPSCASRI
jgi:hypothetical protein